MPGLIKYSLTVLPWLALVILFSLVPELPRVPGGSEDVVSVLGHFLVYAVLSALIYRLHVRLRPALGSRPSDSAVISAATASSIGLILEWSQQLFTSNRAFQSEDVIANVVGTVVASATLLYMESSGRRFRFLLPATFALGAAIVAFTGVSYALWDPTLPYRGDHWHAAYRVVICGETLRLFPPGGGNIHTHGDSLIHIHPQGSADEGKNANLATFMRSTGGSLSNDSITLPNGETFTNGDSCPDGSTGVVSVSRWDLDTNSGVPSRTSPLKFVPRNTELIVIEFGPVPDSSAR